MTLPAWPPSRGFKPAMKTDMRIRCETVLRYTFYRLYSLRRRAADPQPLLGATLIWAMYLSVAFIPAIVIARTLQPPWLPNFVVTHPAITAMLIGGALMVYAHLRWVRSGDFAKLDELYESESVLVKRVRGAAFWLWFLLIPVSLVIIRKLPG